MKTIHSAIAICAVALGACAYPAGSGDYRAYQVAGEQTVRFGVVESVRPVRIVGAIAGTILGGIIGHNIEQDVNQRPGVELTVMLDSGRYLAVVQAPDEEFQAGDRVRVLSGRGATRVTH